MPNWLRYWPLAVPVVWCALICAFMRPDALKARESIPETVKWLIYDEVDLTALVLRGANAHMGRTPGRADEPAWDLPPQLAARLDAPQPPYSERFYLEYPVPALALFRLAFAVQPGADGLSVPPAVADSSQHAVSHFVPRDDAERRVWTCFRVAGQFLVCVMAAALVALMLVAGRGYEPGERWGGPVWLAALPGAVFFALNRFDILPALMTALGFACLGRGRPGWSGAWLAAGVLLKVYPVLFVPVVLRHLGPSRGFTWLLGFAGVLLAGFGLSAAFTDWTATVAPLQLQMSRTVEDEFWTFYGRVLPTELGRSKEARLGLIALALLAAVATRPADLTSVLRRCALVLILFVSLAVFWSPQWILWFLPLTIPLARRDRWLLVPAVALDVVNYVSFPILFWLVPNDTLAEAMIYARAAAWFGLAVLLLRREWAAKR
jgi:hypothetical protein